MEPKIIYEWPHCPVCDRPMRENFYGGDDSPEIWECEYCGHWEFKEGEGE